MASGDPVVQILEAVSPQTAFAPYMMRTGGSSPAENVPHWAFDAGTAESTDYVGLLKGYGGGGLTITLAWMAATATTGVARFGVAFRRLQDDAEDVDTSQTYDFNYVDDTCASASGELSYFNIPFTNGADMDSLADGEMFIMRVTRDAAHANDTMSGDAQLVGIWGKET